MTSLDLSEGILAAIVARVLETNREDLEVLERDVAALEAVVPPYPRMRYAEAAEILKEEDRLHVRRRLRRARRGGDHRGAQQAVAGHALAARGQGVLHEARPRRRAVGARRRRHRTRGLRRESSEGGNARPTRRSSRAKSRSTSCRKRRSSGTSTCAATVRFPTADSASASSAWCRGSAVSSTCARRSRSRARSTGSTRSGRAREPTKADCGATERRA